MCNEWISEGVDGWINGVCPGCLEHRTKEVPAIFQSQFDIRADAWNAWLLSLYRSLNPSTTSSLVYLLFSVSRNIQVQPQSWPWDLRSNNCPLIFSLTGAVALGSGCSGHQSSPSFTSSYKNQGSWSSLEVLSANQTFSAGSLLVFILSDTDCREITAQPLKSEGSLVHRSADCGPKLVCCLYS